MITPEQAKQLIDLEIDEAHIEAQIKNFKEGFTFANLSKPAKIGDGIIQATDQDIENWTKAYDEFSKNAKIIKFVPASGAATRMFKVLYEFLENPANTGDAQQLLHNLHKFAFAQELKKVVTKNGKELSELIKQNDAKEIISNILYSNGLNYGSLPKALLLFHEYKDEVRTATEEHVAEGVKYALSGNQLRLHFTISPEHEKLFKAEADKLTLKYEKQLNIKLSISHSFQKKSTDTIAVDMNNEPITDEKGHFVFRPGGHGALLDNLNDLEGDLVFIKNIDNVVPDFLKHVTIRYKKALAGLLIQIKNEIADILTYLEWHDTYTEKRRHEIARFMETYLGVVIPEGLDNTIYAGFVKSKLDKPIRICGMVKNAGEPGGGPFWVTNRKGELKLQIIESSQVDPNDKKQQEILQSATHFNPVDLVCYTKDYTGHHFNLLKYRDSSSGFITEKSLNGKKIKAQELPGLWNGGMAHWITLFVEVPSETFNPVKTVFDLLRKEHQMG